MGPMEAVIPPKLRDLLNGSQFEAKILDLASACCQVLLDNKMPFFPAYTDHGSDHVEAVLKATEKLIPDEVWESEQLESADAAVLIGAVFLHDLAMHLREPGFLALVSGTAEFHPRPWFDQNQAKRGEDLNWPEMWQAFRKRARYLSHSQRERLFGPRKNAVPAIAFGDADRHPEDWTDNDRLLIGEFLRSHHHRLAHEIALYGLPGIDSTEFPVLKDSLPPIADAIGAVARSHGEDLRTAAAYLDYLSPGNLRPSGAAQLYLMALLRVGDYFQLQQDRASPLLLHLREPQSPASVSEWVKHQAIETISWKNKDPDAVMIEVSASHDLRTHLQVAELIDSLQNELDLTAAVLGETYGSSELKQLQLKLKRVRTNLHDASLRERLSFIPRQARLRSAEDLFRLVVSDLYGNEPSVAGREMLQNAADAVREKERWVATYSPKAVQEWDLPADVLVEVREMDGGQGELAVVDNGIGMTPSTIIDSFLTAGVSFRGIDVEGEGVDPQDLRWMKAGRFGVGCFASFLLGSKMTVTSRHISEDRGVAFTASLDEDLIQLDWADDVPVGTEIVVPFSYDSLPRRFKQEESQQEKSRQLLRLIARFYEMSRPSVRYRIAEKDGMGWEFETPAEIPVPGRRLPDDWRSFAAPGFDAVLWQVPSTEVSLESFTPFRGRWCRLAHNGIAVEKPGEITQEAYQWGGQGSEDLLLPPSLAVFDLNERLGITLNRYELTEKTLPFEGQLLESIAEDLVASALAVGPAVHPLAGNWGLRPLFGRQRWFPMLPALVDRYLDRSLCVIWSADPEADLAMSIARGVTPSGQWRHLPYRIALEPKQIYGEGGRQSRNETGFSRLELVESVKRLGETLRLEEVVSLLSRPGQSARMLNGRGEEELLPLLSGILDELAPESWPQPLALTVYRVPQQRSQAREELLAKAWIKTIDGPLGRSGPARAERREALTAGDRNLRALVNKWSRLAERRNPRTGAFTHRGAQV
jgi:hypothetical protein